jgi:hypothetical protein
MKADVTMADKLAVLQNELALRSKMLKRDSDVGDPQEPTTYYQRQVRDEAKSKFPAQTAPQYPAQPPDSPWSSDPCGTEPPLGFDVNAVDP